MKKLLVAGMAAAAFCGAPALAADLPVKAPVYKAVAPMFNWTGFYVGLHAGYGWGTSSRISDTFPDFVPASLSPDGNGFIGGAQAGYNWQSARFLAGLEVDISYSGIHGSASGPNTIVPANVTTLEHKISWFGTVRGRLGVLPSEKLLLFATGGLAFGETKSEFAAVAVIGCGGASCAFGSTSRTALGWALGGGFEYAFSPRVTWKAEYLYLDLGSQSVTGPITSTASTVTAKSDFQVHIARAGLNFKY
jgi:outer membrane immunogenic protein